MKLRKHTFNNIIRRSAKVLSEDGSMRKGIDMLNWQQLQVGDLVDVDAEFNSYPKTRITQKIEDVSQHSGLEPGLGFIGVDDRGDEFVFSINDVIPTSYEKYAFAENRRVASVLDKLIKEYSRRL